MLSLVTQSDGSARRFPFVVLALAVGMSLGLAALWEETQHVRHASEARIAQAIAYFEANPFVETTPDFERIAGRSRVEERRSLYLAQRRTAGLPLIPKNIVRRTQGKFDYLLESSRETLTEVPARRYAVSGWGNPEANFAAHLFVHASLAAFVLSILVLIAVGTALEDAWGSLVFGGFCAVSALASALAFSQLYPSFHVPWFGGGGLAAALLGAALVRQFRCGSPRLLGVMPLPAWALVPAWVGFEYLMVRGAGADVLETEPVLAHAIAMGLGSMLAVAINALGLEAKRAGRGDERRAVNPAYERAMLLREKGKAAEAFALLLPEFERDPRDGEVALALWDLAREAGSPLVGMPMILAVVKGEVRSGNGETAVKHWIELADQVPAAQIMAAPPLALQVADALLRQGQPSRAMEALTVAVSSESQLNPVLAQRAVRLAQLHDPELARRAARMALDDPGLADADRAAIAELVGAVEEPPQDSTDTTAVSGVDAGQDLDEADALSSEELSIDAIGESKAALPEAVDRWNSPGLVIDLSAELPDASARAFDLNGLEAGDLFDSESDEPLALSLEEQMHAERRATPPEEAITRLDLELDEPEESLRAIKPVAAVPIQMDDDGFGVEIEGQKKKISWQRVDALGVAAVAGLGDRPVLLLDLVLNWQAQSQSEPLRVIRLRSDAFDPRQFCNETEPLAALRWVANALLKRSGARPLPSAADVRGNPFANFPDLASYERDVLLAEQA